MFVRTFCNWPFSLMRIYFHLQQSNVVQFTPQITWPLTRTSIVSTSFSCSHTLSTAFRKESLFFFPSLTTASKSSSSSPSAKRTRIHMHLKITKMVKNKDSFIGPQKFVVDILRLPSSRRAVLSLYVILTL